MDDEQTYRESTFEAETPIGRVEIRAGERDERTPRLLEYYSVESWAFLTAWNPDGTYTNETENRRRQEALEAETDDREYETFSGKVVPDHAEWAPEQAVLVVGIDRESALEIAREFGQDTIVFGEREGPARLIDCESGEDVTDGAAEEAGEAGASGELDELLEDLGSTVRESVERYRSEPPNSMENTVDWELVLRSLDDDYPDPDLD